MTYNFKLIGDSGFFKFPTMSITAGRQGTVCWWRGAPTPLSTSPQLSSEFSTSGPNILSIFTLSALQSSPLMIEAASEKVNPHMMGGCRDIQRLLTTPFSLVLRKEYFDCPQRGSHAVHYI